MPKLHHEVEVYRATAGAVDDYNQPALTFASIATIHALIQSRRGDELALTSEGGPVRGRYRVFVEGLPDIQEGDHLVYGAEAYELTFVENAGGANHHLEIDAERVYP
jgi:hypothetical protein